MKTIFLNLINQADLQINGKTIEPTQPYINIARHFQLLSEMSVNDLKPIGHSLGFSDTLDNYRSMIWYDASGNGSSGNGLTNNRPYIATAGTGGGFDQQIAVQANKIMAVLMVLYNIKLLEVLILVQVHIIILLVKLLALLIYKMNLDHIIRQIMDI